MSRRPVRGVGAAAIALLALLSLRPFAPLEALVERAAFPLRLVAQVTLPARFVAAAPVRAADQRLRAGLLEAASSRSALDGLYRAVVTRVPELVEGRRQVPAVVVERDAERRDRIVIRPWTFDGLAVGQPVVHREAYVGRVARVDLAEGLVEVDLVTGRDFFVGARVVDRDPGAPTIHLVVGGLAAEGRRAAEPRIWLAAHNPSRPPTEGRRVVVDELLADLDPLGRLAEGYGLGTLEAGESDGDWRVRPVLDFLHGLYHVVVLTEPGAGALEPEPPRPPLEEPRWVAARPLTPGDPSPWRESLSLDVGHADGVRTGAAVVCGARLIGRVGAVSEFGAEVRLIGDPGAGFPTVGSPVAEVDAEPRVLGRMVAVGRDPGAPPTFLWRDVTLPSLGPDAAPPAPVRTRLFSGSGEAGLPAGLVIGEALLPRHSSEGRGHRVRLLDAPPTLAPRETLWVRVDRRASGRGAVE